YKGGYLYVSHKGKITELELATEKHRDLVTNLPSLGDHQNGDLLFGPDGAIYFGQGTATNAGVVGSDNFVYAWADRYPNFHDIPSRDFTLTGENYTSLDLKETDPTAKKTTGAFAPFGKTREPGETVKGQVPANGAVHRLDMEDGTLSIFADGLRNPYGLTLDADGNMYASVLGYDDRGVRASTNSPDWIVKLEEGAWYGWPDFAGTVPLTDKGYASKRGVNRNPIIQDPPEVTAPLASLPIHYSPMKIACAPEGFGTEGIFVSVFGDGQPLTQDLKQQVPSGVLVVDPETGDHDWFVKTKGKARAGRLGDGLKRVIDVKFDKDGRSLYVLDFGVWEFADMAPNAIQKSGVLWKITKD
ncbi:MAG TPA: glucose dehydrogenase, partial [Clostridia bacterium]|nr:glucose dehydrogenase [Clostridia bacterium]